jgi:hypothetical protein
MLLTRTEVAVIFLATGTVAGSTFVFCSFWVYHYVDLEHDIRYPAEEEPESPFPSTLPTALDISEAPLSRSEGKVPSIQE